MEDKQHYTGEKCPRCGTEGEPSFVLHKDKEKGIYFCMGCDFTAPLLGDNSEAHKRIDEAMEYYKRQKSRQSSRYPITPYSPSKKPINYLFQ